MEEAMFPFINDNERVIIAMKGLPCTGKSIIANDIAEWAKCPVLYMDDSLMSVTVCLVKDGPPSGEEADHLQCLAFHGLCKSAHRHLSYYDKRCVVIKSRLDSTLELDHLLQLSWELSSGPLSITRTTILIIDCHVRNEHRLLHRMEEMDYKDKEWFKARSRLDFEKARDDWLSDDQPQKWDLHLFNLINAYKDKEHPNRVIRLMLDPFDDLNLVYLSISLAFQEPIHYLLSEYLYCGVDIDNIGEEIISYRYEVVHFNKLMRYLAEREIESADSSGEKSEYLCPTSRVGKCCVFKTGVGSSTCGVCDESMGFEVGYTCHFCFLTLHKSCAEHQGVVFPADFTRKYSLVYYPTSCTRYLKRKCVCKACDEGGKPFSQECNACLLQTHLKGRKFPTIIKHDCHPEHFLSLQVSEISQSFDCKVCPDGSNRSKYGCYICGLYYCLACVLRPRKAKYNHGGHRHILDLVYSRDATEELEEDYWCCVCYNYMDPHRWFYNCRSCPSYEAHPNCIVNCDPDIDFDSEFN